MDRTQHLHWEGYRFPLMLKMDAVLTIEGSCWKHPPSRITASQLYSFAYQWSCSLPPCLYVCPDSLWHIVFTRMGRTAGHTTWKLSCSVFICWPWSWLFWDHETATAIPPCLNFLLLVWISSIYPLPFRRNESHQSTSRDLDHCLLKSPHYYQLSGSKTTD